MEKLKVKLRGKIILLGIGNELRGDDAFGTVLAKRLRDKVAFKVFEAGSSPENFLGKVINEKPDTLLIVDAVDFGGEIADIKILGLKYIKTKNFFLTHNPSLSLLYDFFKRSISAKFYLLAIQPKSIALGGEMCPQIESKLEELTEWFKENYPICQKEKN